MAVVSMTYLLEAGVHFGHQTKRWNPKMKEYIFTSRDDIYIIDLQKTVKKIEEAYKVLNEIAKQGGKVLFVGTKKQAQEVCQEEALRSSMYYVIKRWLGGTLTNFKTIRKRVGRLIEIEKMEKEGYFDLLPKKEVIKIKKEYDKLDRNLSGIREMKKVPEALIIVDPRKEINAILEARKLNIPVIGIVDTNCDPDDVDYPIPANDDAIRSVKLVIGVLTNAICEATGFEVIDFLTEEDKAKAIKKEKRIMEEALKNPIINKDIEHMKEKTIKNEKANKVVDQKIAKQEIIKEKEVNQNIVEKELSEKQIVEKKIIKSKNEIKEEFIKNHDIDKVVSDLDKLTVVKLKEIAKAKGILGYSKLKKDELIALLKAEEKVK